MAHQLYGENNLRYTETGLKNVSGKYNGVYKGPRALYTKISESFIYFQNINKRISEILNTLERMVEDLYEVGNQDAQYYEEIVGETMDIVLEYDL